jgi:hypothetical protein
MLVSSPAMALEPTQFQAACYTDCKSETHSNPEYKSSFATRCGFEDSLAFGAQQRLPTVSSTPSWENDGAQTSLNAAKKNVY